MRPTLLEQMGGVPGIVASTIPVVVFVVANLLLDLRPAVIAALVSGVAVAGWRIARRQPLQPAVSGLFGVGIAAFLAYRSGEARAFYLPGLIYSGACGLAFLVSVLVRWPLAGVIWHGSTATARAGAATGGCCAPTPGRRCCGRWYSSPGSSCRVCSTATSRRPGWASPAWPWATRWSGSRCSARSGRSAAHAAPRSAV